MESFKVPITQSPEMIKRLGEETYNTPEDAIDELVQNARDAGASEIKITINSEKIIFEDDGQGFNKERIQAFCKQGTNYKIKHSKVKGKNVAGNKGIGRYAIFKLSNISDVRSKNKEVYSWTMDNTTFFAGNTCEFFVDSVPWNKENESGTEFILTNLTESGKELLQRIDKLKQLIVRNWDVDLIKIYINNEKLKPESIEYEKGYSVKIDSEYGGCFIKGELGLTTKEGQINGILIKVNGRGVGRPRLFELDRHSKYGMLIARIRGVIHIDNFADIINVSRNDFIRTRKYESVAEHIKDICIKLFEKKMKQQEKIKNSKFDKMFKNLLKDINHILDKLFKNKEGVFKNLAGDLEENKKGEEVYKLDKGEGRGTQGDGKQDKKNDGKDIIGKTNIKDSLGGNLKIGKYNYKVDRSPLGIDEKLVVLDGDLRKVIINTDHPTFKIYSIPKNLIFLGIEIIYSTTFEDNEFPNEKIREIVDETMRGFIK